MTISISAAPGMLSGCSALLDAAEFLRSVHLRRSAMRTLTIILVSMSVLVGAALVRGVGYALTRAVGFSFGAPERETSPGMRQPG